MFCMSMNEIKLSNPFWDFYRFLDGSLQAQNISAVTIDVSNLKIGGENFDIREL